MLTVWLFAGAFSMLGFWIGDSWFALRSKKEDCIFGTNLFGTGSNEILIIQFTGRAFLFRE